MTGTITFNGTASSNFGLIVEKLPPSIHAARRGDLITIPGRNGVIVRADGSFETYQQEYQISFSQAAMNRDPYRTARDIAVWLLGASGFCRLEDGFEPDHFRMARYSGGFDVGEVLIEYGKATLTFDVQPQRYLKSGETPIRYEGVSGRPYGILNPTQFESRPLLKFVDTTTEPQYVAQTLTMRDYYFIDRNGNVISFYDAQDVDPSLIGSKASVPVSCSGKEFAKITGNGFSFLDADGKPRGLRAATGSVNLVDFVVAVPSWAVTVSVSTHENDPVALSLRDKRPNPGDAAVQINGITINLDFSDHDTIFLDCDLHDAYYADGTSANAAVSFTSRVTNYPTFPSLSPGVSTIIPGDGSNLDFELTPRWWTL